jgi:transcriptional regulator with XRE-family HTH domain
VLESTRKIAGCNADQELLAAPLRQTLSGEEENMRGSQVANQKFGNHVRKLRHGRGLTQEALAAQSSLSVDAVRRVEHGTFSPSLDTVRKLAWGLNISLKTLFESFERKRRKILAELCDFLATRSDREVSTAWQVIRAMLSKPGAEDSTG